MNLTTSQSAKLTLPTDDQILVIREFDAPRHLVFKAMTTPELVRRWWHAKRGEVTVVEIDLRVGGKWRYVMVADDGTEVGFHGEYREIAPAERLVTTEVYEGLPEGISEEQGGTVNTATFADAGDGRTELTLLIQAPSKVARDAIIESGMEDGLQDALDLLEENAQSLSGSSLS
jgi:uncharacterized protein YndB with AHSA1/START domain